VGCWLVRRVPVGWTGSESSAGARARTVVAGARSRLEVLAIDGTVGPDVACTGATGAVFWGELYELGGARRRFRLAEDVSPAAVVAAAYRASGQAFAAELKGRFVAVVYDTERDELVAARDRVGFVPLFVRGVGEAFELAVATDAFALSERPK